MFKLGFILLHYQPLRGSELVCNFYDLLSFPLYCDQVAEVV